jgi:uncharacterized protein YeaO (DUF488 family)
MLPWRRPRAVSYPVQRRGDFGWRLEELRRRAREEPLTIVYAARDREHNDAVVLAELLRHG